MFCCWVVLAETDEALSWLSALVRVLRTERELSSLWNSSALTLEKSWSGKARFKVAMMSQSVLRLEALLSGPNADWITALC